MYMMLSSAYMRFDKPPDFCRIAMHADVTPRPFFTLGPFFPDDACECYRSDPISVWHSYFIIYFYEIYLNFQVNAFTWYHFSFCVWELQSHVEYASFLSLNVLLLSMIPRKKRHISALDCWIWAEYTRKSRVRDAKRKRKARKSSSPKKKWIPRVFIEPCTQSFFSLEWRRMHLCRVCLFGFVSEFVVAVVSHLSHQ